jgi:hypothetical protein
MHDVEASTSAAAAYVRALAGDEDGMTDEAAGEAESAAKGGEAVGRVPPAAGQAAGEAALGADDQHSADCLEGVRVIRRVFRPAPPCVVKRRRVGESVTKVIYGVSIYCRYKRLAML